MILLWSAFVVISIFAFVFAIVKFSWVYMLISAITSTSIAYYFWGANNSWKYLSFIPVILLIFTVVLWFLRKKKKEHNSF